MRIAIELDVAVRAVTVDEKPVEAVEVVGRSTAGREDPPAANDAGPAAGLAAEMNAPPTGGMLPGAATPTALRGAQEVAAVDAGPPMFLPPSVGAEPARAAGPPLSPQGRPGNISGNGAAG